MLQYMADTEQAKEFIKNYFEVEKHTPADGWYCAELVTDIFNIDFPISFTLVGKYLSREVWKTE